MAKTRASIARRALFASSALPCLYHAQLAPSGLPQAPLPRAIAQIAPLALRVLQAPCRLPPAILAATQPAVQASVLAAWLASIRARWERRAALMCPLAAIRLLALLALQLAALARSAQLPAKRAVHNALLELISRLVVSRAASRAHRPITASQAPLHQQPAPPAPIDPLWAGRRQAVARCAQ